MQRQILEGTTFPKRTGDVITDCQSSGRIRALGHHLQYLHTQFVRRYKNLNANLIMKIRLQISVASTINHRPFQ